MPPCRHAAMPRRPRVHLDGVPLHIAQRGRNRQPFFLPRKTTTATLHRLGEAVAEFEGALHAHVL